MATQDMRLLEVAEDPAMLLVFFPSESLMGLAEFQSD
jgi:hypothetical protein